MTIKINVASFRRQLLFWLIAFGCLLAFLIVFRNILLPFIAGMALAYFLDPVADWLESHGFSRLMATSTILVAFVLIFVLSLVIIVPVLASQAADFIDRMPGLIARLQDLVSAANPKFLLDKLGFENTGVKEGFSAILREGASFLTTVFGQIWNSGKALLDIAALFVVTPVVAFYLLLDWDNMTKKIDGWLPRDHLGTVRNLVGDMDNVIAGFVRGQGTVCLILGVFYAVSLTLAGLNFGLLIGLFVGLISFVPYVGSIVGLVLSLGVALVQFWPDYTMIAIIAGVFFIGQLVEGNFLQPKLVGNSVGLHPVWLMFALFAFGSVSGFVGMLVAVPAAATIGVLVRFALKRYLDSDLYAGDEKSGDELKT